MPRGHHRQQRQAARYQFQQFGAKAAAGGFKAADDSYLDPVREMEAAEVLADAKRAGDPTKIAAAQKAFDDIRAQAAQRRAMNPDA